MWRRRALALAPVAGIVISLLLIAASTGLDGYLRRGGGWGDEVTAIRPTPRGLGANTFLHLEAERAKVDRTARMLREGGFTYARQQFAWNEIEPRQGQFADERTGRSTWEKYDYLVAALAREGVRLLVRVENTPVWARPGQDTVAAPFGPPTDFDRYAAFVEQVVRRYRGQIAAVQVWNEPNVRREWGERPPDPVAYADLLRRTYAAVKAADPAVLVVAAGLAPTDGLHPTAENDILFLEGMYQAGAKGAFDAMAVMVYGLGQSPDDRRLGLRHPINFSRPVLTREVMVRHGDGATPIWAAEYGWVSVTPAWEGGDSTWGASISEEKQAQYLVRGLERMRGEWPWMGVVCVWAFRFVEATMPPADAQRHFAIVRDDFSPRPAYLALAARPTRGASPPGVYAVRDEALRFEGTWETQTLGGREYRLAGEDARLRLTFVGTRVSLLARGSLDGGRLWATVDGEPVPGLRAADGRSYVSFRAERTGDAPIVVASGLPPERHTLELTAAGDGVVAVAGVIVSAERPAGWALRWLHGAGLLALWLAVWATLRRALRRLGYLPSGALPALWGRHGRP